MNAEDTPLECLVLSSFAALCYPNRATRQSCGGTRLEQTSKSYHGHRERCALCLQTLVLTMFDLDPVHTSSGDPGACDCSLYSWKMAQVDNLRMIRILNDVGLALALHCRQIQERDEALCKANAELQRLCLNGVPPLTGEKLLRIQCDIGDNTKAVSAFLSNLTDPKAVHLLSWSLQTSNREQRHRKSSESLS